MEQSLLLITNKWQKTKGLKSCIFSINCMVNKQLYLVGTFHIDPDGKDRLDYLFRKFSPKIITAEAPEDRTDWFDYEISQSELEEIVNYQIEKTGLKLNTKQKDIFLEIVVLLQEYSAFEFKTARLYCNNHLRCKLIPIDMSFGKVEGKDIWKAMVENESSLLNKGSIDRQEFINVLNKGIDAYVEVLREICFEEYATTELTHNFYPDLRQDPDFWKRLNSIRQVEAPENLSEKYRKTFQMIFSPKRDKCMAVNIRKIYAEIKEGNIVVPVGLNHLLPIRARIEDLNPKVITLKDYDKI